jgi:hypothetical protein
MIAIENRFRINRTLIENLFPTFTTKADQLGERIDIPDCSGPE